MRILIVNPFGIGDVLFSTPLISNLKAAYPESYLGYICNSRAKDALDNNPQIDEIFVFEKDEYRRLWKEHKLKCIRKFVAFLNQIKKARFDIVIDLSLGYQYSLCLWLIGIKMRIGYNYRNRGRFLTHKIDINGYNNQPVVDYYLDLLKFLHIQPRPFDLKMTIADTDRAWAADFCQRNNLSQDDLIVGIIPAGGASWGRDFSYRHWPWESYARLAERLSIELNIKVIIFGDSSENAICQQVQDAMKVKPLNACGKTTLKQFAALLAKCSLVVCNDGGPLHVAVSQGVMTVSIFGPVDEKIYGPYPPAARHIVVSKEIDCRPCYQKFKLPPCPRQRQCIRGISIEQVFQIIKDNLSSEKGKR